MVGRPAHPLDTELDWLGRGVCAGQSLDLDTEMVPVFQGELVYSTVHEYLC